MDKCLRFDVVFPQGAVCVRWAKCVLVIVFCFSECLVSSVSICPKSIDKETVCPAVLLYEQHRGTSGAKGWPVSSPHTVRKKSSRTSSRRKVRQF